ncbi:MAG: DUF6069 family protein [Candidatus Dormibacteria bacterium]|jgi:peptidoglycan/LPS O-acetylase OafA/YrhL
MATSTASNYRTAGITRLGRTRALGVGGAVLAAVAVWVVAVPLLSVHLLVRFGSGAAETVGVDYVVGASLIASLAGWALLVMLERRTSRARSIWTVVAIVVLLASVSLPFSIATTTGSKTVLALMHVAVAVVLIPVLRRGANSRNAA